MVNGFELKSGDKFRFNYMNETGTIGGKIATLQKFWFGTTKWHPDAGILVEAIDAETNQTRYFYAMDMTEIEKVD